MKKTIIALLLLMFTSCQEGLEPQPSQFLKGTVYFENEKAGWPPEDSLKDLRVVALKNFPPDDLVNEIVSGNAYFTDSMPYYRDSVNFSLEIDNAPVELKYIGVAQSYGSLLEWRVVGVYSESGDNTAHTPVSIEKGIDRFIKIHVDFNDIPPQPFELP